MYMDAIKKKLTLGVLVLCLAGGRIPALAQQMDPALTATVIAQTTELKNIHKKRKKTQEKIIAAEAAVTVALDRVHSVEDKMLKYLSNAQGQCRISIRLSVQGNWWLRKSLRTATCS